MLTFLLTLHHHVVNVHFHYVPYFTPEHPRHHPLICGPNIFKPRRHHGVVVVGIQGDECCLFLVLRCQGDLMIPLKGVQIGRAHV